MENPEKKTNGYAALATYLVAVVCLILGLFLPLFDGQILALQLPDAFNKVAGSKLLNFGEEFSQPFSINLFGSENAGFDFSALSVVIYAVVTLFAVIALIPIGVSTKNGTKTAAMFMYVAETCAVLALSLYLVCALQNVYLVEGGLKVHIGINMLIAFAGTVLPLIVLSVINKGKSSAAKLFLFVLSAIALIALYDITLIIASLAEPLTKLYESSNIHPLIFGGEDIAMSGIGGVNSLLANKIGDILSPLSTSAKAAVVLCAVVGIIVLINYFIDIFALSTNSKRGGYISNVARYGLEFIALIALIITVAVCKYNFGLMLIVLSAAAAIQLAISVARFVLFIKKSKSIEDDEDEFVTYVKPVKQKQLASPPEGYTKPVKVLENKREPIDVDVVDGTAKPQPSRSPEPNYNIREEYNGQSIRSIPDVKKAETEDVQQSIPLEGITVKELPEASAIQEEIKPDNGNVQQTIPLPDDEQLGEPVYQQPTPQPSPQPVYQQPKPQPSPQPEYRQFVYAKSGNEQPQIFINAIYGGSTDEFIRKLTNDEKIEFMMTFIERNKDPLKNIPEYKIGGNNKAFFSSVFIYLGRIRGLISENLLNKMYKELNML